VNACRIFVERPVMTTLVMAAIFAFGLLAYFGLPVNDLPNVDFPTIEVSASLSGAGPETMAASVATPLEKEFATISGLDSMTSVSYQGSTRITLQFALDRDIDAAAQDVQAAIASSLGRLPDDMTSPPGFRKVNPAAMPILYLAVTSPTLPLSQVTEYAETVLSQHLSMVSGVAQVMVYGSQKHAVRIRLDPEALAARGLGVDEVVAAVRGANVNLPTGTLEGAAREFTIRSSGQIEDAEAYRKVVVAWKGGAPVRLASSQREPNPEITATIATTAHLSSGQGTERLTRNSRGVITAARTAARTTNNTRPSRLLSILSIEKFVSLFIEFVRVVTANLSHAKQPARGPG